MRKLLNRIDVAENYGSVTNARPYRPVSAAAQLVDESLELRALDPHQKSDGQLWGSH
jgi:hypothetical protein